MRRTFGLLLLIVALALPSTVAAKSPTSPQKFDIHDATQDGLQPTDPDIGNVSAVANPGGQDRLVLEVHLHKAAPNCTYTVELVRSTQASNGGLSAFGPFGHSGIPQELGSLTTNKQGNGNFHYDDDPNGTSGDDETFAHLDFEDYAGACTESDGTTVGINEYGAAPLPELGTPFRFLE